MSGVLAPPAIRLNNVSKIYPGPKGKPPIQAVQPLSLQIDPGEVFGLLGSNGAGKTTLIKMICGLTQPTTGTIEIFGINNQSRRLRVMPKIGAVLEGTRNVYWRLTAWENLIYFGRLKGKTGSFLRERAEKLLRELDLWQRRDSLVKTFSRGMQQKLAIACAVIADPPIVLLDEPTLGLDVSAAKTVSDWVTQLAITFGKTVILTTHQLEMAQSLCQRVAIMGHGSLLAHQPVRELIALFRRGYYQITFSCDHPLSLELPPGWTHEIMEETHSLSGPVHDDQILFALLKTLNNQAVRLGEVKKTEPNLEEVFLHLTEPQSQNLAEASLS